MIDSVDVDNMAACFPRKMLTKENNPFILPQNRYGAGYDLATRRKNATRESTATLKAWLNDHKKNPYPTKGEKIMLAIITKMTLTQVSTWFANARRRLKKENKMTWEPKNRVDDEDDDDSSMVPSDKPGCYDIKKEGDDDKDRLKGKIQRKFLVDLLSTRIPIFA